MENWVGDALLAQLEEYRKPSHPDHLNQPDAQKCLESEPEPSHVEPENGRQPQCYRCRCFSVKDRICMECGTVVDEEVFETAVANTLRAKGGREFMWSAYDAVSSTMIVATGTQDRIDEEPTFDLSTPSK